MWIYYRSNGLRDILVFEGLNFIVFKIVNKVWVKESFLKKIKKIFNDNKV